MKRLALALTLSLAAAGAHAQKPDTSSGSYGRSSKSRNSAGSRIGGTPTNPAESGSSSEGRTRAGFEVGVASATAGGRTDTGPAAGMGTRQPAPESPGLDRAPAPQPPSLARPTREEILEAQKRGRIRDREEPDRVRGPQLTELEIPNPFQVQLVVKNPYRHRQDDVQP